MGRYSMAIQPPETRIQNTNWNSSAPSQIVGCSWHIREALHRITQQKYLELPLKIHIHCVPDDASEFIPKEKRRCPEQNLWTGGMEIF
ncbi:UNVERIFIED_CONTAM: hypothetical protein K2H54_036908 [Gekko kuhli]